MSTKRGAPKEATLPEDPKWVVIDASDGDPRRWPTNTTPNPDAYGNVNFMQPLSIDNGSAIKWRIIIGQALAEMHKYPDYESKRWVLKEWPVGYQFYDHHKGQLPDVRHDLYLVGSECVARFRSPAEFIPHAYWLMTDPTRDRSNCRCKYCLRIPQREISDAFGLSQRSSGSPSKAHFVDLTRNDRNRERRRRALPVREGRVFATVRRAPKPVKLPKGPKHHVNPERENDLRALLGSKTLGERRWAREGELIWVKLDYPIPLDERDVNSERILFWPGIIEEVHFKAEITPRRAEATGLTGSSAGSLGEGITREPEVDDVAPWTIVHKSVYKIHLLVSSKTVLLGTDHILPYQSHAPDDTLLSEVQSFAFSLESHDDTIETVLPSESQQEEQEEHPEQTLFKRFQSFDPFPPVRPDFKDPEERVAYLESAVGAFATAIQVASRLTIYWTPTDKWEYKMQDPSSSSAPERAWSVWPEGTPPAEQQSIIQKLLGSQVSNPVGQTAQIRFQGLWWGPERIWMGELVRLKLARYQLAPEGTESIKKPSGAGRRRTALSTVRDSGVAYDSMMNDIDMLRDEHVPTDGIDEHMNGANEIEGHDLGATSRSLFLRVDGLFVAQVLKEDGITIENECRMCGMLYELADEDWEASGEEYGEPMKKPKLSQATTSGVIATPLRNIMPERERAEPTVSNGINGSVPRSSPPASSTSGLFTPNPELLSEPAQADVTMLDGTGPDALGPSESISTGGSFAVPASTENIAQADSSAPKSESSSPFIPSLSGPLSNSSHIYPTPPPPSSLKFRPILRDDYEVVMPLTTLAGRYYPGLLSSSLLQPYVSAAMQHPDERRNKAMLALEGLVPGAYNSVDASRFLPRRRQMLREAENLAWSELVEYWRRRAAVKRDAVMVDGFD